MTLTPDPSIALLAKLRHVAQSMNLSREIIFLLYVQQGLLARLALSPHHSDFVLKGGLSLFARYQDAARPTRDIDLAARSIPNTPEKVKEALHTILSVELPDQLSFDAANIEMTSIQEQADYSGVRAWVDATVGKAKITLQLDISFGNAITPHPHVMHFPQILISEPVPVRIYPLESVVAEKCAALLELGAVTTRMKDLYDLFVISSREDFEMPVLTQALDRTFANRNTPATAAQDIFTLNFAESPILQKRWQDYLARTKLQAPRELGVVMKQLEHFVLPAIQHAPFKVWRASITAWED